MKKIHIVLIVLLAVHPGFMLAQDDVKETVIKKAKRALSYKKLKRSLVAVPFIAKFVFGASLVGLLGVVARRWRDQKAENLEGTDDYDNDAAIKPIPLIFPINKNQIDDEVSEDDSFDFQPLDDYTMSGQEATKSSTLDDFGLLDIDKEDLGSADGQSDDNQEQLVVSGNVNSQVHKKRDSISIDASTLQEIINTVSENSDEEIVESPSGQTSDEADEVLAPQKDEAPSSNDFLRKKSEENKKILDDVLAELGNDDEFRLTFVPVFDINAPLPDSASTSEHKKRKSKKSDNKPDNKFDALKGKKAQKALEALAALEQEENGNWDENPFDAEGLDSQRGSSAEDLDGDAEQAIVEWCQEGFIPAPKLPKVCASSSEGVLGTTRILRQAQDERSGGTFFARLVPYNGYLANKAYISWFVNLPADVFANSLEGFKTEAEQQSVQGALHDLLQLRDGYREWASK